MKMLLSKQKPHYYSDNNDFAIAVFAKTHPFINEITNQKSFFEYLDNLVTASFGSNLGTGEDGSKENFLAGDFIAIFTVNNVLAGFASCKLLEPNILFLHAIVIKIEFKGIGFAKKVLSFLSKVTKRNKFACTTQNPLMYCMIKNMYKYVFPDITGARIGTFIPHYDGQIGDYFKKRNGHLETGVIENLYEKCLYPSIPMCNDSQINEWFIKNLKIVNGKTSDGILILADQDHTVSTSGRRFGGWAG